MRGLLTFLRRALKLGAVLVILWTVAGLALFALAPFFKDALQERVRKESGIELSGSGLDGYFYFYKAGIRLNDVRVADDEGRILEAQSLEIEFNPLSQWLYGFILPVHVNLNGASLLVQTGNDGQWSIQQRYHFPARDDGGGAGGGDTAERGEAPGADRETARQTDGQTTAEDPDEAAAEPGGASGGKHHDIELSPLDIGSDLDDMLSLFTLFGGRINMNQVDVTLHFLDTGVQRVFEGINIAVQGGDEPELALEFGSPGSYTEHLSAEVGIDRSSPHYLQLHYEVSITNLNRSFFDDFFPNEVAFDNIDASIRLAGSANPIRNSHEFEFAIKETNAQQRARGYPVHLLEGAGIVSAEEYSFDINLSRLLFQKGDPVLERFILIENLIVADIRDSKEPSRMDLSLDRLRFEKEAGLAIVDIKNRLVPDSLGWLDDIVADLDIRKISLSADLRDKKILEAAGQVQVNYLQVEKGTHFSNISFYITELNRELDIHLRSQASSVAIAGVTDPVNIHAIRDMTINVSTVDDEWFIEARAPEVELTPRHKMGMGISLEFKSGFSPWIKLRFDLLKSMPMDVVQSYIPRQVLNPALDRWLWDALPDGAVDEGRVEYGGNIILDQPEIHPETFTLTTRFSGISLKFQPLWPALESTDGKVEIRDSVAYFDVTGSYLDIDVGASGKIVEFSNPVLHGDVVAEGPYSSIESFLLSSPLADQLEEAVDKVEVSGWISAAASLSVNLDNYETQYQGRIDIHGLDLKLIELELGLSQIYGRLYFAENSIRSENLRAYFGYELLHAQIDTVEEMGAERISLELTTSQSPQDILGLRTLLATVGISGKSDWYLRFLSGSINPPPEDEITPNDLRTFLYFYSDFVGTEIADNTSINKSIEEPMPLSVAITDTDFGDRVLWLVLDDKIDGRIFLEAVEGASELSAAYVKVYQEQGGETIPVPGAIMALAPAGEAAPPPAVPADSGGAAAVPPRTEIAPAIGSLLIDSGKENLQAVRAKGESMWQELVGPLFFDSLINKEIIVEGGIESIRLEPWTSGFTEVADVDDGSDASLDETGAGAEEDPAGVETELIYRINMQVGQVDAFDLLFHDVDFDFIFADNSIGIQLDSLESDFSMYYDVLNREAMQIDINRLSYQFAKDDGGDGDEADQAGGQESDGGPPGQDSPARAPEQTIAETGAGSGQGGESASPGDAAGEAASAAAAGINTAQGGERDAGAGGGKPGAELASSDGDSRPGDADTARSGQSGAVADAGDTGDSAPQASGDGDAGLAEAEEGAGDAGAAPAPPAELVSREKYLEIYSTLHGLREIDFFCRRCQIDDLLLVNLEASIKARDNHLDCRLRYANKDIKDNITVNVDWARIGDAVTTRFAIDAKSDDLYKTVRNHGVKKPLLGGEGTIKLNAGWEGGPLDIHYPTFNGEFAVNVKDGVLYDLGSSSAQRLLSIVNILEIPRRFSLDFSDLGQNLEFYRARLNARIINGVVTIAEEAPLHLRSSLGTMDAFGDIDLAAERYSIGAHVVPNVITYTAPVIALLLAGPIAGIGIVGLNWMLSAIGIDSNTVAEQYSIVDSSFDTFELAIVDSREFRQWAAQRKAAKSAPPDAKPSVEGSAGVETGAGQPAGLAKSVAPPDAGAVPFGAGARPTGGAASGSGPRAQPETGILASGERETASAIGVSAADAGAGSMDESEDADAEGSASPVKRWHYRHRRR